MSRILIAEDEPQLRMGIALSLKTNGYEVTETVNGMDALEVIIRMKNSDTPFDLLVCDIQMPKMSGEELLAKLKTLRVILPALVITGYGEKELLVRLMRVGCRDFMDKPFEPDTLCTKVAVMLADCQDLSFETRRKEHLAAIGEKTLQTVHDLNNILSGAIGYADLALEEIEPKHPIRHRLEKMITTSSRAAEICKKLLCNYRTAKDSFRIKTEINSLTARVEALLRDIAPENVTVKATTLEQPVWLTADGERLQQALLNLGLNAFNAMPKGGKLILSVSQQQANFPGSNSTEEACIVLTVCDTGIGITEEKMANLFEESNTTRSDDCGLGLSIVKQIVEQEHEGWIVMKSEPGKGTCFSLFFSM